jgi:transcriptional regulator with XRE-family HTH domain
MTAAEPTPADHDAVIVQAIIGLPMRLRAHRAAHDLSLRDTARRVGVAATTLMRIERGEDYAVSSLLAVAAYLDEEK